VARIPLYRRAPSGAFVAELKAGQNVTITDAVVGDVVEVTIGASGGGGGGGGTPASSVVSETTYGQQTAVGTSTDYARADHSHGSVPLPAHSSTTGLAWASSGHTGSSTSVAAWNGNGNAEVVQATADETMLVRRGGTLQWVPLLTTVLLISGEYVLEGDYLANEPVTLYTGTLV
jgi:hypothetical protein